MLDAMASGAGVFEPEEVAVLTKALDLALDIRRKSHPAAPDCRAQMGRLIHNLGRSRIKYNKRLSDAVDAVNLAEEAADLFEYVDGRPEFQLGDLPAPSARTMNLFPAIARRPPISELPLGS